MDNYAKRLNLIKRLKELKLKIENGDLLFMPTEAIEALVRKYERNPNMPILSTRIGREYRSLIKPSDSPQQFNLDEQRSQDIFVDASYFKDKKMGWVAAYDPLRAVGRVESLPACRSSNEAEYQAILLGLVTFRPKTIWTDCSSTLQRAKAMIRLMRFPTEIGFMPRQKVWIADALAREQVEGWFRCELDPDRDPGLSFRRCTLTK